ncbi:odorant receptor 45b-like isoform X2 [Coccinella septempunctata]|uniref:odorant receptor 45b-like isoform X2 n=1 Tax=Coccinella septempunctata TaxID=41139 RepID=UPI001D096CD5|nr:odorant receptor 45b-like isoform X2 [Coccinella septempunctata]
MYFWKCENMVKFVNQYMNTCRTISENPREFYRSLAIKRNLFKYFIRYVSMWNLLVHFFEGSSCSDNDLRFACGLFLPLWYPVETNYFPVREILVLVIIALSWRLITLVVHLSIDSYIIAKLFEYKCQSLIKLMQKTSLSRVQNLELVKQKFRDIVGYHQDLKLCFDLIRDVLGGLTSPGMICFIPITACYSTAFAKNFNSAYLLEGLLLAVLCYLCFYSWQKIIDLGEIIQEAAYNMDWYDMDKAMNKEYLIFLMKLQRPHELQSVIFVLQMPLFLQVMRSVYSFFMLMYQMN